MSIGVSPVLVRWVADYDDGSQIGEQERLYPDLPREGLRSWAFVATGVGEVLRLDRPEGAKGSQLVQRRRTFTPFEGGVDRVLFLAGWVPHGPAAAFDCATGIRYDDAAGFHPNGCAGRCGQSAVICAALEEPVSHPHEGERWS